MPAHSTLSQPVKAGYLTLACLSLLIGVVGIVTPLLPTTPFLLLSAWSAAKGSPRLHQWLTTHPGLSKPLRAWQQERAIPSSAKRLAILMLASSWLLLILLGFHWATLSVVFCLFALIGAFIFTRPSPQDEDCIAPDNIIMYKGCKIYSDIRAYADPEVSHE